MNGAYYAGVLRAQAKLLHYEAMAELDRVNNLKWEDTNVAKAVKQGGPSLRIYIPAQWPKPRVRVKAGRQPY